MPATDDLPARIRAACEQIAPYLRSTPLAEFAKLSERLDATGYLKAEHLQVTGSFKARGAREADRARCRPARSRGHRGQTWYVMADPEGTEFCLARDPSTKPPHPE